MLHKDLNLRKIKRYGAARGPLSGPGGRSVREGLRRAKPVKRYGALVTIWFFNLYLAIHYIRLALAQQYDSSLLDKIVCLIVLPFAILFLKDRKSWLPALAMLGYGAVLMLGALIFPNRGVSQPFAAILTIALDFKLAIMTFAFAWLFKRTGSAMQVFESLSILIIVLCLINTPFIFYDLSTGVNIKGYPLGTKGILTLPNGLLLIHTEVASLYAFGAFVTATRYRLRKRTLDLMLCALFVTLACFAISVSQIVGCLAWPAHHLPRASVRIWFVRHPTCGAGRRCGDGARLYGARGRHFGSRRHVLRQRRRRHGAGLAC